MEDALVLGRVAGGGGQPRLVWVCGGCTHGSCCEMLVVRDNLDAKGFVWMFPFGNQENEDYFCHQILITTTCAVHLKFSSNIQNAVGITVCMDKVPENCRSANKQFMKFQHPP